MVASAEDAHTLSLPSAFARYNDTGRGRIVLICEHASNTIPAHYESLGLSDTDLGRHIAWDIGALALSKALADQLDAPLVHATFSRLLLDLNRDPSAPDSIATLSEDTAIPGNQSLSMTERAYRQRWLYEPFHAEVSRLLDLRAQQGLPTVVVSIHSFTPRYHGIERPWHVGVLSRRDRRLADALLEQLRMDDTLCVGDNQPYEPDDGVYHTVGRHGEDRALPCVMIEVRNDLLNEKDDQLAWANRLAREFTQALERLDSAVRGKGYPD